MEIWKEVQGHPDYKISSSGKMWSNKTNKELTINYGVVMLDGQPTHFSTLMGIHFIDGYQRGMTLFRKDSSVPDWSLDNLQLITPEEVFRSAEHIEKIKNGWVKKCGKICAYRDDEVLEARSTREIAILTGVPKSSVAYCLKTGTTHKTGWFFSREEPSQ